MTVTLLGGMGLMLFAAPLASLLLRVPWAEAASQLWSRQARDALQVSLLCSVCATALCLILGLPVAWILTRTQLPGRSILRAITTLPVVLPPVVGGVALLLAFGREGVFGSFLDDAFGIRLAFSTYGVILAETFVAMPFLVLTVCGALQSADRHLEEAARTLGASPWTVFRRITLPQIRPSLLSGAVLCWARALGEFGATITFAGNLPGTTQTLPLAVYVALEQSPEAAVVLSLLLVAVSLSILIGLRKQWAGGL
ncbi:molybdenum ABC transporter permease subunit [Couchioplanes caeruleus subsp. caeruleus]|uniref:Molybdenum transport system permease n=1 Tax=Couchioplanes caeruleus subsp. caeruleus TaxID=56427 RepID=A0A1K0FCM3_9ACTN|nr:molybdenum ABC transporter permease subunit [Couchioplanes caeruleus subsp. caeruleus]